MVVLECEVSGFICDGSEGGDRKVLVVVLAGWG